MLSYFKEKIKIKLDRITMINEFYHDYKDYKKWNYNSPHARTQNAQDARILRQTHILEKGLSLSNPRMGFGKEKIKVLLFMLDEYIKEGFCTDDFAFQNAICILNQYSSFQKSLNYENTDLSIKLDSLNKYRNYQFTAGILHATREEMYNKAHGYFPVFFHSRHSIRQFSDESIDPEKLRKAVQLAQKAPTACNRQACKVYFYNDPVINRKLGELIAGNNGFENEVKHYLVITADISAFYNTFERNQLYIEAGIFSMALMQALHFYGIASCALQNGEYYKKNQRFKTICKNIPKNEKIAIFIAIGMYKEEFNYAVSKRKNINSVLIRD